MELPFREVYKCSWLKLPSTDKKSSSVAKVGIQFLLIILNKFEDWVTQFC